MHDGQTERLDQVLVSRGLSVSRARARDAIKRGHVRVAGQVETRPARRVSADTALSVDDPAGDYVARSALKLIAALDTFSLDPTGRTCLDVGASTGGFTQVLLERGCRSVHAVDVGHGQIHDRLRADTRVAVYEGYNARDAAPAHFPDPIDVITVDVSFISLRLVLPAVLSCARGNAWAVLLVKPQFEVGPRALGRGGLVGKDVDVGQVVAGVEQLIAATPMWQVIGRIPSPIAGGDGNLEYLVAAQRGNARDRAPR